MSTRQIVRCEGKQRFASFRRAQFVARRVASRREGKYRAYPCRDCGGFHVGAGIGKEFK